MRTKIFSTSALFVSACFIVSIATLPSCVTDQGRQPVSTVKDGQAAWNFQIGWVYDKDNKFGKGENYGYSIQFNKPDEITIVNNRTENGAVRYSPIARVDSLDGTTTTFYQKKEEWQPLFTLNRTDYSVSDVAESLNGKVWPAEKPDHTASTKQKLAPVELASARPVIKTKGFMVQHEKTGSLEYRFSEAGLSISIMPHQAYGWGMNKDGTTPNGLGNVKCDVMHNEKVTPHVVVVSVPTSKVKAGTGFKSEQREGYTNILEINTEKSSKEKVRVLNNAQFAKVNYPLIGDK